MNFIGLTVSMAAGLIGQNILLLVGFIFGLLILLVLHSITTIINRRWFAILIFVFIGLFFFVVIYDYFTNRPPKEKPRIAVMPILGRENLNEFSWQSWALWDYTIQNLHTALDSDFYILPKQSILDAVQIDSLSNTTYARDFARRSDIHYLLNCEKKSQQIAVHFHDVQNNSTLSDTAFAYSENEIFASSTEISKTIIRAMNGIVMKPMESAKPSLELIKNIAQTDLLLRDEKYDRALELGKKLDSNAAKIQLAKIYLERGKHLRYFGYASKRDFHFGIELIKKVVAEDSSKTAAYVILAELAILQKKWGEAEGALKIAFEQDPTNSRVLVLLAQLHPTRYHDLGFKNEEVLYKRVLIYDQCSFVAVEALANYYQISGDFEKAKNVIARFLDINPQSVPAWMAMSKLYIARSDVEQIIEIYEKILKMDPLNAEAFYNLGITYYHIEDFETSARFFERAIQVNNHLDSHYSLGLVLKELGETDRAIENFRVRVRRKRDNDDPVAEAARQQLYELTHAEETVQDNQNK